MLCTSWSIYDLWKILGRQRGKEVFSQWRHISVNVKISLLKSFRIPWHWYSVLLWTFEVQKLLETMTSIIRWMDVYEKHSVCLSIHIPADKMVSRGIKHIRKGNVKYIKPNLLKSGCSSCFITEDLKRLSVDRMPHTDDQFSLMMLS